MYSAEGTCNLCSYGYYLRNNTCYTILVTPCVLYSNKEICLQCSKDYILMANGKCQYYGRSILPNCGSYQNVNGVATCKWCNPGFTLLSSTNQCIPTAGTHMQGCYVTKDGSNCFTCHVNYFF